MWSDNETETDFLNFADTVSNVTELLSTPELQPMSLGLFGGWGSGKSSLMRMVMREMQEDSQTVVIHFDAWRFQGYDDARAALLETIGQKLLSLSAEGTPIHQRAFNLLKRVDKLRALGLAGEGLALAMGLPAFGLVRKAVESAGDVIRGNGDADDLDALKAGAKDVVNRSKGLVEPHADPSPPEAIEQFRNELKGLLEELSLSLVVFIDNLDRCLPKNAIHTLEAVRLFLFMERTAFVIAADVDMIRVAVREHYKTGADSRLVNDYLDKLVQYPVRVPTIGESETRSLLMMLLLSPAGGDFPEDGAAAVRLQLLESLQASWKEDFPTLENIISNPALRTISAKHKRLVGKGYQIARLAAPVLANAPAVRGNPRIVKRMLNTLSQRQRIAARRGISLADGLLLKLVLFERIVGEAALNDLFAMVARNEGRVPVLAEWEESGEAPKIASLPKSWASKVDFIGQWCALEPKLGEEDLRAAVYLTRDLAPLSPVAKNLNSQSQIAIQILLDAKSSSRPSTRDAITSIPAPEMTKVMEALIDRMEAREDWEAKPDRAWSGPVALARADDACARLFAAFIERKFDSGTPKWMRPTLKNIDAVDI
ncbi:MAG: P-loop NTPase fold protein [Litorimonas sp.]